MEEFWRIICSKSLLSIEEKEIEEIVQKETGYLPESIKIGNETISLYVSKNQFFDLVNREKNRKKLTYSLHFKIFM